MLIPCAPIMPAPHLSPSVARLWRMSAQKRGPCKLFFAFRDLERGRASRSRAAASMGEAASTCSWVRSSPPTAFRER